VDNINKYVTNVIFAEYVCCCLNADIFLNSNRISCCEIQGYQFIM